MNRLEHDGCPHFSGTCPLDKKRSPADHIHPPDPPARKGWTRTMIITFILSCISAAGW